MENASVVRVEFPPALMTREVAAYYLGTSLREIDAMKNRGEITAYGATKRIRFKKSELDEWIERLPERDPPGSPPPAPASPASSIIWQQSPQSLGRKRKRV